MNQNSNRRYSQPEDFRPGRISSEVLLAPLRRLVKCVVFLGILLLVSVVLIENYGLPGLRWKYEGTYIGDTKYITRAIYLTPVGFVEPPYGGEFHIVGVFPTPEKYKPSVLIPQWIKKVL